MFANPKMLLAVELNLVGGTYAERCKTRLYWPVSIGVTAWKHPVSNERGRFDTYLYQNEYYILVTTTEDIPAHGFLSSPLPSPAGQMLGQMLH